MNLATSYTGTRAAADARADHEAFTGTRAAADDGADHEAFTRTRAASYAGAGVVRWTWCQDRGRCGPLDLMPGPGLLPRNLSLLILLI